MQVVNLDNLRELTRITGEDSDEERDAEQKDLLDHKNDGSQSLRYRDEIDGLRAFAIIPVVLYVFDLGCPGGFAGVDVFFVISGYLITRILLADQSEQSSLMMFWIRRARRLLPALAVLLFCIIGLGLLVLLAPLRGYLAREALSVLLMFANVHFYFTTDYFFDLPKSPLLHCWSLAVMEQYYVIYPCMLWMLYRFDSRPKCCLVLLVSVFFASLVASIILTSTDRNFAYYSLATRAWQLALGGMVVFAEQGPVFENSVYSVAGSWCGMSMIAISYAFYNRQMPYPSCTALLPSFGCALFIASQRVHLAFLGRLLSMSVPAFIGKISYSVYLWHWPVYMLLTYMSRDYQLNISHKVFGLGLLTLAALGSYLMVERPCRSESVLPVKVFLSFMASIWLLLILVSLLYAFKPAKYPTRPLEPAVSTQPPTLMPNLIPEQVQKQEALLESMRLLPWQCTYKLGAPVSKEILDFCGGNVIKKSVEYADFPIPDMTPCGCPCCHRQITFNLYP